MAANNGDGVRMMLSVEALSVKVSVDLRKRTPHSPRHIARQGSNEHRDNVQGSFVLATKPDLHVASRHGRSIPWSEVQEKAENSRVSKGLRLSQAVNRNE